MFAFAPRYPSVTSVSNSSNLSTNVSLNLVSKVPVGWTDFLSKRNSVHTSVPVNIDAIYGHVRASQKENSFHASERNYLVN